MKLWKLKNPFIKGKGEARFLILRQELQDLRAHVTRLQESIDHLIARPGPDTKTYEHTRDGLRVVPRSAAFAFGYNEALAQGDKSE